MAKVTNETSVKYSIPSRLQGLVCFTREPPLSVRAEGGGKFVLDDKLTDVEKQWLAEVIGIELEKINE